MLQLQYMSGGFTLLRIENSEALSVAALIQEIDSDTTARVEFSVSPEDPEQLTNYNVLITRRPPELGIGRLTEENAITALSQRAEGLFESDQFSGALLIVRRGVTLLDEVWGRADRESGTPISSDTRFRLGSMNKMFTAVATLQLVESGRLSLDGVVGKYIRDYPNDDVASEVTIRHLLTHTGGTGEIFGPDYESHRLTLQDHADYVDLYGPRHLEHVPGAEWEYSNYGFVLLGALIEAVTGTSYYNYLRENVFQPAGMNATDSLPEIDHVENRAIGYMRRDDEWISNAETLPWRGTAAGGGYSTTGDLLRFAAALDTGNLLSGPMLSEATFPQENQYGYGFAVYGGGQPGGYGHGGGAPGMNAELRVFPDPGYVLIGLSNLDPPAASRLIDFFTNRMPVAP